MVIGMGVGSAAAELRSCGPCDTTRWYIDGRPAGLEQVLAAIPSRRETSAA